MRSGVTVQKNSSRLIHLVFVIFVSLLNLFLIFSNSIETRKMYVFYLDIYQQAQVCCSRSFINLLKLLQSATKL